MAFDIWGWIRGVVPQQVQPTQYVNTAYKGVTDLYKQAEQASSVAQTEIREHIVEPVTKAVQPAAQETSKWLQGVESGGWIKQAQQQTPSYISGGQQKSYVDTINQKAAAGYGLPTQQQQTAYIKQQQAEVPRTARSDVNLASAVDSFASWGKGAASGKWIDEGLRTISEPITTTVKEFEQAPGETVVKAAFGEGGKLVTPVQQRQLADVINENVFHRAASTKLMEEESQPEYLRSDLALKDPLAYKIQRAFDITTGEDVARAQRNADILSYNAQLLSKPAIADAQKFQTKFDELVQSNALVGGTYTIDPATNQKVYDYQTYKWAQNAKETDKSSLMDLSNAATKSYTAYEQVQNKANAQNKEIETKTQLITDVLLPYQKGFEEAQETYWRKPIYGAGDTLKEMVPKEAKPYTDVAIGTGAGFAATLPYIHPYVFAATTILPYLPQHIERTIRSPSLEVQALGKTGESVVTGVGSQISEITTGKDIYGRESTRRGEAIGSALALIKGGSALRAIETASPLKLTEARFATGKGEIKIEAPLPKQLLSKVGLSKAEAIKVPESVAYKGLVWESPSVSVKKAVGILPEGYSPEGTLKPIIGKIAPVEGATSWWQKKQLISEVKSPKGETVSSSAQPYIPKLDLEVVSPLYKPKTEIVQEAKTIGASPTSFKVVTGTPYELTQYIAKEGYVPDYPAMSVATPIMQRLYKEVGTKEAAEIATAEMEQMKAIWKESNKPELVKNIAETLPKTEIVPKTITEQTVIYPKESPAGKVSDWSGKTIPSDAPLGKVYHHTEYPSKGVWLTESEHGLIHDLIDGKVKITPENAAFYEKYKIKVPRNTNPKVTELTLEQRQAASKELMDTIKSVDRNHTISGSLTEYLQAKVARLPKDLDMYTDKFKDMGNALGDYYKKYLGEDKVRVNIKENGASVDLFNEKTGKFDIKAVDIHSHEFGGKLGTYVGRYGVKSEAPIVVDGMNLMPLREQRLRKISATMAVGKTPEGQFYSTAMDFRRFKDIGDVLGGTTSMESAAEGIFGKRVKAAEEIAERRKVLEKKIGPESPITEEHKKTALTRYEEFAPTEPTAPYSRLPFTQRYYPTATIGKAAAVGGMAVGGVAAGLAFSAPIGGAIDAVFGQKQPTDKKEYDVSMAMAGGIPLTALMAGRTKVVERISTVEERAAQWEIARKSLEVTEATEFWNAEMLIKESKGSFGAYYVPKGVQVRVAAFEFEGVEGKQATPEFWQAVNKYENIMNPNVKQIVKYGQKAQNLLEQLSQEPGKGFAPAKTPSFKPADMQQATYKGIMDLFSTKYADRVVFTGSKAFDTFLQKNVGRSVFKSDVDITAYKTDLPKLERDIKKVLEKTEPGRYDVILEPVHKKLLHVDDAVTGETVIEFHTFEEFPNHVPTNKKNVVSLKSDVGGEVMLVNPAQALNSRMAGLYHDLVITDKTVALTVKRLKDFPSAIGGFRQLAAEYYRAASKTKGDNIAYAQNIENAKIAENMAKSYEKYLFSKEIERSLERSALEDVKKVFVDARDKLISEGKLPATAKQVTKNQALVVAQDLMKGEYSPGLKGLSVEEIVDELVHFKLRSGESTLYGELKEMRKIAKNLEDPTREFKQIESIDGKTKIKEKLEAAKAPLVIAGATVGAAVAAPYITTALDQIFGTDESDKRRRTAGALISGGAMVGMTKVRGEAPKIKKVAGIAIEEPYTLTKTIGDIKYGVPKVAEEIKGKGLKSTAVTGYEYPISTRYEGSIAKSILGGEQKYTKGEKKPPAGDAYKKTTEYPATAEYGKTPSYAKTQDYSVVAKYPKPKEYPKEKEYPASPEYPKSVAYTILSDYPKPTEYPKGKDYTKAEEYKPASGYPEGTKYPGVSPYTKTLPYPKTTPYPKTEPYPEVTPYPKTTPYPGTVPYPGITPYPSTLPKLKIDYTKAIAIPPPKIKVLGKPDKTEESKKKKRKKKIVTPKHWEYGAGAEPEEVTEFIFGAGSTTKKGGKKTISVTERLSSGLF